MSAGLNEVTAYYNEIDPHAAQWLRELIKAGHIAPGEVDERSIEDVIPSELMGFTQCHFFAGIGVWSHALRQAGWPDDRPAWSGSCPCQPFSSAGKGGGTSDERHLWPAFFWLIRQCRPDVVFGEQVEAAIKHDWLDHVAVDLEAEGYTVGAVSSPACGYGAPHIRQRLYWVAHSSFRSSQRDTGSVFAAQRGSQGQHNGDLPIRHPDGCPTRLVADAEHSEWRAQSDGRNDFDAEESGWKQGASVLGERRNAGILGDSEKRGLGMCGGAQRDTGRTSQPSESCELGDSGEQGRKGDQPELLQRGDRELPTESGPTNGFWRNAEWIPCRDGKARPTGRGIHPLVLAKPKSNGSKCEAASSREVGWRSTESAVGSEHDRQGPTEPGTFPLVNGPASGMVHSGDQSPPADEIDPQNTAEARVMRLRGYGNAIVSPAAVEFIKAFMEG